MPAKNRHPNCACKVCGTLIYRRPSEIASRDVFCSLICSNRRELKLRICPVCGLEFKGQKIKCSRACANKNRTGIKYDGTRPRSKDVKIRQQKIRLIEQFGATCMDCDYSNANILHVHHQIQRKDGGTDAIENLRLLCPNCHYTRHYGDSRLAGRDRIEQFSHKEPRFSGPF